MNAGDAKLGYTFVKEIGETVWYTRAAISEEEALLLVEEQQRT